MASEMNEILRTAKSTLRWELDEDPESNSCGSWFLCDIWMDGDQRRSDAVIGGITTIVQMRRETRARLNPAADSSGLASPSRDPGQPTTRRGSRPKMPMPSST